jgi:hypothetical protein
MTALESSNSESGFRKNFQSENRFAWNQQHESCFGAKFRWNQRVLYTRPTSQVKHETVKFSVGFSITLVLKLATELAIQTRHSVMSLVNETLETCPCFGSSSV